MKAFTKGALVAAAAAFAILGAGAANADEGIQTNQTDIKASSAVTNDASATAHVVPAGHIIEPPRPHPGPHRPTETRGTNGQIIHI
jgi:hypothetical protein